MCLLQLLKVLGTVDLQEVTRLAKDSYTGHVLNGPSQTIIKLLFRLIFKSKKWFQLMKKSLHFTKDRGKVYFLIIWFPSVYLSVEGRAPVWRGRALQHLVTHTIVFWQKDFCRKGLDFDKHSTSV